jgi:glycosyltransferase involved in cell wall biosynthesis
MMTCLHTGTGKTVCLCMIVKNEAHVIARALRSVRPHIDFWCICDTGSADGTQAIILSELAGIPGELHSRNWVNFGYNRTEAMTLARAHGDYVLVIDADMTVNVSEPFKHRLTADAYYIRYTGDIDYAQKMLVSSRLDWRYIGVTHEYIFAADERLHEPLPALTLTHWADGGTRRDKFERDIRLLTDAIAAAPDSMRDVFYLAQSYKDSGDYAAALAAYERRIALGKGWAEDYWYALYQRANMKQRLGHPWPEVLQAFLAAYAERPQRLEPLYHVVRGCADRQDYAVGFVYGSVIESSPPYPENDLLFIERTVYQHLLALEFAICAHGVGRIEVALRWFSHVLAQEAVDNISLNAARRGQRFCLPAPAPYIAAEAQAILVIVAFRNPGHRLDDCIDSLLRQSHRNFRVVLADDASDDDYSAFLPPQDARFRYLRRPHQWGTLRNHHEVICSEADADDIILLVDGDDRLANAVVLEAVDASYRDPECWLTYGQFQYENGAFGICRPFVGATEFAQRRELWYTSHLKTFRAGLYLRIAEQDPNFDCMKHEDGTWLMAACDAAIMSPLLDLSGLAHIRFDPRCHYIYHDSNATSDLDGAWRQEQIRAWTTLERKRPLAPITTLSAAGFRPDLPALAP